MQKLREVEEAKQVMNEAVNWSVMKWLSHKKKVRLVADMANAALDNLNRSVKSHWPGDLRTAYDQLCHGKGDAGSKDDIWQLARRVRHADEEAKQARDDAENTFDEAERQLSTSMAREGCHKAIRSWELHEKALQLAELGLNTAKARM